MDIPVLDKKLEREKFVIESIELFKLFSRFEYAMKRSFSRKVLTTLLIPIGKNSRRR